MVLLVLLVLLIKKFSRTKKNIEFIYMIEIIQSKTLIQNSKK
jgi:hypothetical protein